MTGRIAVPMRRGEGWNQRTFSLTPFPGERPGDRTIEGTIARRGNLLSLDCAVAGNLSDLAVPSPAVRPERRDRLWEGTCLEMFPGVPGSERYWEFNLSPAGHWNVYRFASYRIASGEEPAFPALPFDVRTGTKCLRFFLDLDIGGIIPNGSAIEIGICAVLRTVTGDRSHWALAHPGPRPDFHRRDSRTIALSAGQERLRGR